MAYNPITSSEIQAGSPFDSALLQKIKDNFDAHNSTISTHSSDLTTKGLAIDGIQTTITGHGNRLNTAESTITTHTSNITLASNKATKQVPVGTIRASLLTLAQFQTEVDGVWMLANGGSAAGTAYATVTGNSVVPDMRGVIPRGKNNGRADGKQNPAGDLALGTHQDDAMQGHLHDLMVGNTSSGFAHGQANNQIALADNAGSRVLKSTVAGSQDLIHLPMTDGSNGTPRTASETRMKNVTVNWFIKVGY
jgi:hypothetical protein